MISKGIPVLEDVDAALRIRFLRALVELAPFSKSLERSDLMILSDYFSVGIKPMFCSSIFYLLCQVTVFNLIAVKLVRITS